MKNRVIASIVLIIIALSVAVTSYAVMTAQIGKLRDALYDALYTAETQVISPEYTNIITKRWESTQKTLHIFIIHGDMTQLETSVTSLGDFQRENNVREYENACIAAIHQLDNINESIKINVENIL